MSLTPGSRLGAYTIAAPLGAGGMGEVFRATDNNLGRDVAIKVLPQAFAQDAERLLRFEREARTLAALNHPNIAIIHGVEHADGVRALVMELVEGPTLADLIRARPLPLDEVLPIARQIAEALEAAHEQGIIHRDLKPANIKVRDDGTVKVLDFGLAKVIDNRPAKAGRYADGGSVGLQPDVTRSPTITTPAMTQMGVILGTAAYMSPEQAKGREADKRSDMWSFGAVVYETLTGRRAFDGDDMSETLASVIKSDPDWTTLPSNVPPAVRTLLRTCLQKDPRKRTVDATTALYVLNEADAAPATAGTGAATSRGQSSSRVLYTLAGAVLAATIVGGIAWTLRPPSVSGGVAHFSFELPSGQQFTNTGRPFIAVSPDGSKIVYVANRRLYLRSMPDPAPREIQGTEDSEGVTTPSFSPDGNSIVFVSASERALKRISINSGVAVPVCPIVSSLGVSWTQDGIVFAEQQGNVFRVAPSGGKPQLIFKPAEGEGSYGAQMLPGGSAMLLTMGRFSAADLAQAEIADEHIVLVSLPSGERRTLIEHGADARYVPTGHIIYAVDQALFGVRFDLERLQVVGDAVPLVQGVRRSPVTPGAQYAVSGNGSLIYVEGSPLADQALAMFDRQGGMTRLKVPNASYQLPRLSPDGKRLAVEIDNGRTMNIWIYDLSGAHAIRQLTLDGRNQFPVWSPDGERVAFSSNRGKDVAIWVQRADGAAPAERVTTPEPGMAHTALAWHPRDPVLLLNKYATSSLRGASSLWTYSLADKKPSPVAGVESQQPISGAFSPDGRWIAYHTYGDEKRSSVFVRPYPPTESSYQVATGGHPLWSRNGTELFFSRASSLFVTSVTTSPGFERGVPSELPIFWTASFWRNYDVSPDGTRVIAVVPAQSSNAAESSRPRIEVVLNWFEELKRLVPQ